MIDKRLVIILLGLTILSFLLLGCLDGGEFDRSGYEATATASAGFHEKRVEVEVRETVEVTVVATVVAE